MIDTSPLTGEGDRSGVSKPQLQEKARNCLRSAIARPQAMEVNWPPASSGDLHRGVAVAELSLQRACRLYSESLGGEDV